MILTLKSTEAAAPTGTGTASNVGKSTIVRCVNSGTSARLVTLEEAGGTDIGTFTVPSSGVEYIHKNPTDEIFAAHAEILLSAVARN